MHDTERNTYGKNKSRPSGKKPPLSKREETRLCSRKSWSFDSKKHRAESDSTENVKFSKHI